MSRKQCFIHARWNFLHYYPPFATLYLTYFKSIEIEVFYMKHICIIMAVYNGAAYLAEQIDSILQNTYQNFTLHIFDDNSRDDSWDIIEQYMQSYPHKIIGHHHTENHGVIRNFLEGCQMVSADYYMFCDQDDIWMKDKISHTVAHMESLEQTMPGQPIVVFGDACVVDQNLEQLAPSFQRQSGYHTDALDLAHLLMENKLIGCTILFNHALQQKITTCPPQIRMHDWWIALIGASFGCVSFLDEPLLLYRQHGNNVVGNISQTSYIRDRISNLRKQRQVLYRTCEQASAFLQIYGDQLEPAKKELVNQFATIPQTNWFTKRYRILHYHFLKSGFIRNLGVLLII